MKGTLTALLCFFIFGLSFPQNRESAICQTLTGPDQQICQTFYRALAAGRLLAPADSSAYGLFQELLDSQPLSAAADTLRRDLVRAIYAEATQGLARVIRAQMDPDWESLVVPDHCPRYAHYFESLVELLPEGHPQAPNLLAQQWYLEGMDLRRKALRTQPADTVLLRQAIRRQLTALDLDNLSANISNELGVLFFALRDYPQSSIFFAQAAKKDSIWAAPLIGLSRCHAQAGDAQKALQLGGEAVNREPAFPYGYLNLAHLIGEFGDPLLSVNAVEKAVETLAARPVDRYTRLAMAGLLLEFDLFAEAEPLLEKVLAVGPALSAYLRLASLYDRSDRLLLADSVYRICIDRWPEDPEAYLRLGLIYHGLGRYPIARQYYEAALERAPNQPEICYNLGLIYEVAGQTAEAEELYLRALAYPVQLESIFDFMDSAAAGVSSISEVIYQLPEPTSYFQNTDPLAALTRPVSRFEDLIYLSLGNYYDQQGQPAAAIPMFESVVLLNPGQAEVYPKLIRNLLRQGAYQRAHLFSQLYDAYILPDRENKEVRAEVREMAKLARKKGARRVPVYRLEYYFYVLDNLWPHLYGLREPSLNLGPAGRKAGQKSIPRLLRKWEG